MDQPTPKRFDQRLQGVDWLQKLSGAASHIAWAVGIAAAGTSKVVACAYLLGEGVLLFRSAAVEGLDAVCGGEALVLVGLGQHMLVGSFGLSLLLLELPPVWVCSDDSSASLVDQVADEFCPVHAEDVLV